MTGDVVRPDHQALDLWEPHIRSFVCLDPEPPRSAQGPLSGLSVGVKDIIDVAGLPTRNGSAACAGAAPASTDAGVVARLRAAGAAVLGKTVTTEFAFTDPTGCSNPYDLTRSPGGSSSGSGAAVGAGLVDFALGTQTAGSLCRPAAYCGAVGLKPGYGALPLDGVTPLAQSFDTVGVIARRVGVARAAFTVMADRGLDPNTPLTRVTDWLLPGEIAVHPDVKAAFASASKAVAQCATRVKAPPLPCDPDQIVAQHRTVMLAEAATNHAALLEAETATRLRPNFGNALRTGRAISQAERAQAQASLARATFAFWQALDGIDAVLTLPVPEAAPKLDGSTGYQNWLTPWTVFGGPLVCLPWGMDRLGRPLSVMLASRPGTDLALLDLAESLERLAPPMPLPRPPTK